MDRPAGQFDLHIDQGLGMGYIRHRGSITLQNLNASVILMGTDPEFKHVSRGITDLRDAKVTVTPEDVRSHAAFVARLISKRRRYRWAIVAQAGLAYSLSRIFDIVTETISPNIEVQVFKDTHEAEIWLGVREERRVS